MYVQKNSRVSEAKDQKYSFGTCIYIHVFHQEPSTITYISRPPFPHQCPRDVNFGQC